MKKSYLTCCCWHAYLTQYHIFDIENNGTKSGVPILEHWQVRWRHASKATVDGLWGVHCYQDAEVQIVVELFLWNINILNEFNRWICGNKFIPRRITLEYFFWGFQDIHRFTKLWVCKFRIWKYIELVDRFPQTFACGWRREVACYLGSISRWGCVRQTMNLLRWGSVCEKWNYNKNRWVARYMIICERLRNYLMENGIIISCLSDENFYLRRIHYVLNFLPAYEH